MNIEDAQKLGGAETSQLVREMKLPPVPSQSLPPGHHEHGSGLPSPRNLPWRAMKSDDEKAGFSRADQRHAKKSAHYYSECFMKGVSPDAADEAALDSQKRFQKWWVESTFHDQTHPERTQVVQHRDGARVVCSSLGSAKREIATIVTNEGSGDASHQLQHHSPARQHNKSIFLEARGKKRRLRGVRDVIDDVTCESSHEERVRLSSSSECGGGSGHDSKQQSSSRRHPKKTRVDEENDRGSFLIKSIPNLSGITREQIELVRDEVADNLRKHAGDTNHPIVKAGISILESYYASSNADARNLGSSSSPSSGLIGTWYTLSKPTYAECIGVNPEGDFMYSLGRMSFDMFRPTGLRCSIQGIFNTIQTINPGEGDDPFSIPRRLRKEVQEALANRTGVVRTYNIVTALSLEPNQTFRGLSTCAEEPHQCSEERMIHQPIRGIMTNYGYILPDPNVPNRFSIWFTGGSLEVNDEDRDLEAWKQIFNDTLAPKRGMKELARILAARILLGAELPNSMEEDGTMNYRLRRPIGGHGTAFCDVLYLDDRLRIIQGHHGSVFVFYMVTGGDESHEDSGGNITNGLA